MNDITTILNCYRRPQNMLDQVAAVRAQTTKSKEIWMWINDHHDNRNRNFSLLDVDAIVRSSKNFKFHSRFALGLLATTKYVAFFDDDTIPGDQWFESCLQTMETSPGILGGAGIILHSRVYDIPGYVCQHERVGWPSQNSEVQEVDLVGHAWFLRREDLNYLWREVPYTLENCEDMQLSYLAQKYGGIKTYCPPHPLEDKRKWSSLLAVKLGDDDVASSNAGREKYFYFCELRNNFISHAVDNGWKTVRDVK